ncbi:MAG: hypothetical protein ACJ8BW_09420 [Ktedonobacteraceae bacterium]
MHALGVSKQDPAGVFTSSRMVPRSSFSDHTFQMIFNAPGTYPYYNTLIYRLSNQPVDERVGQRNVHYYGQNLTHREEGIFRALDVHGQCGICARI